MTILCSIVLKNKNYKNVARKLERRNIVTYIQRKKKSNARKFYSQQEIMLYSYTKCKYIDYSSLIKLEIIRKI